MSYHNRHNSYSCQLGLTRMGKTFHSNWFYKTDHSISCISSHYYVPHFHASRIPFLEHLGIDRTDFVETEK